MDKWEYTTVKLSDNGWDSTLNQYGEIGWELVTITEVTTKENMYNKNIFASFKRKNNKC